MSHPAISHPKKLLIGLGAALIAGPPALAQQATTLPTITVTTPRASGASLERPPVAPAAQADAPTTTRAEAAAVPAGEPGDAVTPGVRTSDIGTQVAVVTRADIVRQQIRTPIDALRGLPGVQVSSSGSLGSLTQIRIRGAEGRHTRVVIDGIEVNTTTNGEFDFSNLLADDIERIEIIRGPMSAIYGSGALGGTINIITRTPNGPPRASLRAESGSFGTRDVAARVGTGGQAGYIAINGQWRQVDGFNIAPLGSEKDGTQIANAGLRAGIRFAPNARLDLTLRHTDKRADFDDFGAVSRLPFLTADDARNTLNERSTLAGVSLAWDHLGGALSQEVKGNFYRSEASNRFEPLLGFGVGTINHSRSDGDRWTGAYTATYRMDWPAIGLSHAITGLLEAKRETFTPFSDFGFADGDGTERSRQQRSAGVEWRGTVADRLTVTAGARHDDNATFRDFSTWRASASYAWRETGLRPHASVGTGVKLPGMYDQFGPSTQDYQANPNLKPETSFGWDAGVEWTTWGGRALFDVTYFAHDLKDKITGFGGFDPVTGRSFTTNDPGTSQRRGVEVSSRLALAPAISLGLAYTYTDATRPDGSPEPRRARHGGRGDLAYTSLDGLATASLIVTYNGRQPDRAFTPSFASTLVTLDDVWLVGIAGSYKLAQNLTLFGRVENALDRKYQEIYGYQAARAAAYVGLKIDLGP
jgi:vitamin B12 transporter